MGSNWEGNLAIEQVESCTNVTTYIKDYLLALVAKSYADDKFGKPMLWIGIYVALASLLCVLAMLADLLHGLRNRKLWFPCKYFTLNAASLTIVAVAMKLPMDLNTISKAPKLGSVAFMCTIMANLLPSLSTMDNKELLTNIIALGVLVITLVVNVCIQLNTGILFYSEPTEIHGNIYGAVVTYSNNYSRFFPIFYVALLLVLLMIYICSSLAILKSKQILESKYKASRQIILRDPQVPLSQRLTVEKLKQLVISYWIMAETGSPQFMTTCSAATSAAGVICAISAIYILRLRLLVREPKSDYKWSLELIFIIQYLGVFLGSIAPVSRCFATLSFKMSIKWIWNHIKVFKVERYWTQKLSDWRQTSIPFAFRHRKGKVVIQKLKVLVLTLCIEFQKAVVIACKMIGLLPIFFVICVSCCFCWLKALFTAIGLVLGRRHYQQVQSGDLRPYVLQLQNDMELAERTLKRISNSVKRLIQKAEKQQPNNLMKLLEKSRGFEGVEKFISHLVPPLVAEEFLDCWSLALVTLTTIAISLPNIQHIVVDRLLRGVSEGIVYVTLVEKGLNASDDYFTVQKVAKALWLEVEICHKWLGNKLQKLPNQVNTAGELLRWFKDIAKNVVTEVESTDIRDRNDDSIYRSISANSMYRISETILLSYNTNIEEVSHEELFEQLSWMISDILAACLTNLPQVVAVKCHTSEIEKREASVRVAAQLLGETMQIINSLEDRELPNLSPDELAYIDKWRANFQHPFP